MTDPAAACARGRARPSSSRPQGDALGGTKGEPEDAEMRRYSRGIRVRGVVGSVIPGSGRGADVLARLLRGRLAEAGGAASLGLLRDEPLRVLAHHGVPHLPGGRV